MKPIISAHRTANLHPPRCVFYARIRRDSRFPSLHSQKNQVPTLSANEEALQHFEEALLLGLRRIGGRRILHVHAGLGSTGFFVIFVPMIGLPVYDSKEPSETHILLIWLDYTHLEGVAETTRSGPPIGTTNK